MIGAGPAAAMLADGKRLHLQHGPIDLIVEADGPAEEVRAAYRQAVSAFGTVLEDLVRELPLLRKPCRPGGEVPGGAIAANMHAAALAHWPNFVTPMVAVAGAVADHMLSELLRGRDLARAYVNNGGDIAIHLRGDARFDIAICANPQTGESVGRATIGAHDRVRGVATSGWRGRSHSLGIADAVTVLARDGATADAAATMIANRVDLDDCDVIHRRPARELAPDSDLESLPVTVAVGRLTDPERAVALDRGLEAARGMREAGLVEAVLIALQGEIRTIGSLLAETRLRPAASRGAKQEMDRTYA